MAAVTVTEQRRDGRVGNPGRPVALAKELLRSAGCTNRNIYREKVTGARADRRELSACSTVSATATRIDRLARSTFDLFRIFIRSIPDLQVHRGRQG
jgi:hypothetical protein